MWRLATRYGPGYAELAGLARADVRTSAKKVTILQAATDDEDTKSEAGERTFDIDDTTAEALRTWFVTQMGEELAAAEVWQDSGKAFTYEDGGQLRPDYISHRFELLTKKAGLPPIRFHDLRHVAATLTLAAGTDMKVVSEVLGHSSVSFTKRRVHVGDV